MPNNKYLKTILGTIGLIVVLALALFGVKRIQQIFERASTPTGTSIFTLVPNSTNFLYGNKYNISLKANVPTNQVDGFQFVATASGTIPQDLVFVPASIPNAIVVYNSVNNVNGNLVYKYAIVTNDPTKPIPAGTSSLGYWNFTAQKSGNLNISFDSTLTKIVENQTTSDILITPDSESFPFLTDSATPTPPGSCISCVTNIGTINSCVSPDPVSGTLSNGSCNSSGATSVCGNTSYCCTKSYWTTDMTFCGGAPSTTPTPIVKPTSTPTPSPVSSPVSTSVPTTTPTPSPVSLNRTPVISTLFINFLGFFQRHYSTTINAYDLDGDNIQATINGLPKGLSYVCTPSRTTTRTNLSCQISGTLNATGIFRILFAVSDGKPNGLTVKTFNLRVISLGRFWPFPKF